MKPIEVLPVENDAFNQCKLNRKIYAVNLTEIVKNYPNGFVLALNNKWGDGKTTFVKMWQQYLKDNGFQSVFYNAWENDYQDEALLAILAEIHGVFKGKFEKSLGNLIEKGTKVIADGLPVIIKGAAKKITQKLVGEKGFEELSDTFSETVGEQVGDYLEKSVKKYNEKKENIKNFKIALEKFTSTLDESKPLIIFIDELDRCKPDFAVNVLECIKHLFDVNSVVFVLSVDKNQLANSIKGYYGSDSIDGDEYLRRFIDVEFSLPKPDLKDYFKFIYEKLEFSTFFKGKRAAITEFNSDSDYFSIFCFALFENKNFNLRQIYRFLSNLRLILFSFNFNQYLKPTLVIYLYYLKQYRPEIYQNIKERKYTIPEIIKIHKNDIQISENIKVKREERFIIWNEFEIFMCYERLFGRFNFTIKDYPNEEAFIKAFSDSSINPKELYDLIKSPSRGREYEISLDYIFEKIEFTNTLNFN